MGESADGGGDGVLVVADEEEPAFHGLSETPRHLQYVFMPG